MSNTKKEKQNKNKYSKNHLVYITYTRVFLLELLNVLFVKQA